MAGIGLSGVARRSWNNNNRDNVLSSNRNNNDPDNRNENIGFRAVVKAGSGRKVVNAPKHPARSGVSLTAAPAY